MEERNPTDVIEQRNRAWKRRAHVSDGLSCKVSDEVDRGFARSDVCVELKAVISAGDVRADPREAL
jgi:hypothetical protein